jgi:hypothetical protein
MHRLLLKNGYSCCVNTVAKLMHEENIKARISKRFKVLTTDSNHDLCSVSTEVAQKWAEIK